MSRSTNLKPEHTTLQRLCKLSSSLSVCLNIGLLVAGSKAEIVQVPRDQALSELVQILKTVATHHPATVADCRLPRTLAFFREEAARMVRNMPPGMSPGDLRELLTEQGDLLDELCVHNRPICTRFFDIGSSAELAQQESMVG